MKKKFESQLIEMPFYLAYDGNGNLQFYNEDPLYSENREAAKMDLAQFLVDRFGRPDIGNPIVFKVRGYFMDRCRAFDAGIPEQIRNGLDAHLEDLEGTNVSIVAHPSTYKDFPFMGLILDKEGKALGFRLYSRQGECQDGNDDHRLLVMDGAIAVPVDSDDDE
jgi:hypothetical protein